MLGRKPCDVRARRRAGASDSEIAYGFTDGSESSGTAADSTVATAWA